METITQNLFDYLVDHYQLSEEQLEEASFLADSEEMSLEEAMIHMNMIPAEGVAIALANNAQLCPMNLKITRSSPELMADLPFAAMRQHRVLPISRIGKTLTVAVDDPFNVIALETVGAQSGFRLMTVVVPESVLTEMLESRLSDQVEGDDQLEETLSAFSDDDEISEVSSGENYDLEDYGDEANERPVIRIVNSILVEAMRKRVSDIHIEPGLDGCQVRYRVDGVLVSAGNPPKSLYGAIVSRIKIMSNLDIAEKRIPQDGRCRIRALEKEVDIRVSILPVIHGEKIVMRILDKSNLPKGLGDLGLDDYSRNAFAKALAQPYGMIFVTGPTGSGKTTTLYSALQELNEPSTNIITVEDPVEYQLQGINQVQTHADVGLTFAAGLRSILRQDPDIVLVGEVRDFETASIAVQAALTGHLVLSTLHTNDAPGAISRLKNMGIEPFMLASAMILAQAQRLYRRLCPSCKTPISITIDELKANNFNVTGMDFEKKEIFLPGKCNKCAQLGYKGRGGIMEIMEINEAVRNMILKDANADELREVAVKKGMITLQRAGLNKVFDGLTSIDEVLRITSSV
ncbi:ATPase, T2SS/T4P/T4SS family [Kiritimatiellaeota bacterium B1221]|nr:ATPase, T2SS/T4P/T4SS family [Kiritimatiellaeota bacterium B1221]